MREEEPIYTSSPATENAAPKPFQSSLRSGNGCSDHTAYILRLFFINLVIIQLVSDVILLCTLATTMRLDQVDSRLKMTDFLQCLSTILILLKNDDQPSSSALLALCYICVVLNLVVCYAGFFGLHRLHMYPATRYLDAVILTIFVFINNATVFIPYVVVTAPELNDILYHNRLTRPILTISQSLVFIELLLTIIDVYVGISAYSESRLPLKSQSFSSFTWDAGLRPEPQQIDLMNTGTNPLPDETDSPTATTPRPKAV